MTCGDERVCILKSCQGNPWVVAKFLKGNLSLSLRSGYSTAAVRLDAMNEENMDNYFGMLKRFSMRETFGIIQKQFTTWMKAVCHLNHGYQI